ncbi:acyl-CoA dehydrogenase family protein [Clostridium cellulovorans]|uniref:Acyl-CoA dehydrogenase domain-containing protein n=1 Tax=Clostridium cellulovorans (strain ATCC 35296 / DSM 3052 / OCM 3 / 743B) TaxID=573061 RepID=D9SLH6_CLOC7|nr:acyl-CoA dehydrogenase family protein [Clostridium cellulovorans]ADL53613.1 acyl-CoA dehydrogenase domain-containing protein [Clostridium cellulovorans 743B]
MVIELTPEQIKYQKEFEDFVKEAIIPVADENDRLGRTEPSLIEKIAEKGYLGAMIPKQYDGMGLDNITLGILNEEFAKGCSSMRNLLTVHGMAALALLRWGTETQRDTWLNKMAKGEAIGAFALTEPRIGSDAKSIEATAVADGDDYVINGKKKWITMGQIADFFILFAKCEDKPTAFIVEKDRVGFSKKPMSGLLGVRASMIAELTLENCRIPKENLVGRIGTGLSHVALSCLDYGRYSVACGCVGVAQAALEDSLRYAKERQQFNSTINGNQLIQKMITEMVVNIKAARQLYYKAGYLKDICDPDSIMETWVVKYFASTMLTKITSDAIQIHGGNGVSNEYRVERYFRDARVNEIIEGTTQIHEVLIANNAFRSI